MRLKLSSIRHFQAFEFGANYSPTLTQFFEPGCPGRTRRLGSNPYKGGLFKREFKSAIN